MKNCDFVFVNKIKLKPEYKSLDVLDLEVKSFLRAIYDNASGLSEAVNKPIEPEVVAIIKELAESYGVAIPIYADRKSLKPWSTATKMAKYALCNMQASERKSFIREFVRIKRAVNNNEFLI